MHTADLQDRAAVSLVLEGASQEFPRLEHLWVDQGHTGAGKAWIEEQLGWSVEVLKHPPKARGEWQPRGDLDDLSTASGLSGSGFRRNRRDSAARYLKALGSRANHRLALSEKEDELRDYERLCESSQAMIHAVMSRLMLRRLARA